MMWYGGSNVTWKVNRPTTNGFINLMRRYKQIVIGSNKWPPLEENVTKQKAIPMFNSKEGPKWAMLKVEYFKHPHMTHYLYD